LTKRKILIVDDDPDLQRLMSLVLEMAGYEVVTANNGAEALIKIRSDRPDLILLDIMMPEMDGFETCRRLRKLPEGAHIPVIMLSAADQVTDKVKGLRVGANDYVTKPADSRELLARIEAHLRPAYARPAHITAVLGAKSGVGTTMLAINLAVALKQVDGDVILLDWHFPHGDIATVLNLLPQSRTVKRHSLADLAAHMEELDAQMIEQVALSHSSGIRVVVGGHSLETTSLPPSALESVLDVISRMTHHIVIDAGWAAATAWLQSLEIVDELLLVVTPELPVLRRAAVYLEWERPRALFGERQHLIINRAGIGGGISARDIEDLLRMKARARLPEDPELVTSSYNQGVALVQSAPRTSLAQGIIRLAQEIATLTKQVA
jgi:CheY-like chemotaxis protein/MinD-like ATPase involved in chromosome partitioning or flagellar assembly